MKKKRLSLTKIFCSNRPALLFVRCKEIKKKKSFRQRGDFLKEKQQSKSFVKIKKRRETHEDKNAHVCSLCSLSLCFVRKRTHDDGL